jgi:pyruvate dehydrogenase E1 component alpha subunit
MSATAANFAGTHGLAVVFVCENNLYSVHSALDVRQPDRPIHALAPAHGLHALHGDGNDVDVVRDLGGQAVARARRGEGPSLIEFATYRWREHCGPNEDLELRYRSVEEFRAWQARDPVRVYRDRLTASGELTDAADKAMAAAIAAEIDAAVAFAKASPFPAPDALARFVYPS